MILLVLKSLKIVRILRLGGLHGLVGNTGERTRNAQVIALELFIRAIISVYVVGVVSVRHVFVAPRRDPAADLRARLSPPG